MDDGSQPPLVAAVFNLLRRPIAGSVVALMVTAAVLVDSPSASANFDPPSAPAAGGVQSKIFDCRSVLFSPGTRCHPILRPHSRMISAFQAGKYGSARELMMPSWVFRRAKIYVLNHPAVAPCSANPACYGPKLERIGASPGKGMSWPWHWGWLQWTARSLNTARCMAGPVGNISWFFGCRSIPNWAKTYRRVMVKCEGAVIIVMMYGGNPKAIGSGATGCLWGVLDR